MKHHDVVIDFSRRGFVALIKRAFARSSEPETSSLTPYHLSARKASR
jgi:hypothetical protein